jgi:D-beta-D-heptose 7-phosphate kinase/D-beta-D-heptose 1-phosphate adenosyltransferase
MRLTTETAKPILDAIRGRRVLVLGDVMLDEYIFGEVSRISPEAPVPIVRITGERWTLGGAANVASNLKALGAEPLLVGIIGGDEAGARVGRLLSSMGVGDAGLVRAATPTIIKTRVIGQHQQMLRIDREEPGPPRPKVTENLLACIARQAKGAAAIIISDYAKGAVGRQAADAIREAARERGIPWIVDPKPANRALYAGATAITPNTKELAELAAMPARTDEEVTEASLRLVAELGLAGLLVTRSEKGMALLGPDGRPPGAAPARPMLIPTNAIEVFDVSGAGDTVIAAFTAALAAGAEWRDAAMLANAAAGAVVGKMGTATTTPQEILARL